MVVNMPMLAVDDRQSHGNAPLGTERVIHRRQQISIPRLDFIVMSRNSPTPILSSWFAWRGRCENAIGSLRKHASDRSKTGR
jgi:hypothetical protein